MNILKKVMTLMGYLFLRLRPPKNVVRSMSKKSRFRLPFGKQHGKQLPTLLKSERQHLYHIYWSIGTQLSCKKSLLVLWKILMLFVNTLSAIDKYSLLNRDNLPQTIPIQLSQKQEAFSIAVRSMPKKFRFRLDFKNQHGKLVPKLLKSERLHLYHIY